MNVILNTKSKTASAIFSGHKEPMGSHYSHSFDRIIPSHCCKQTPIGLLHAQKNAFLVSFSRFFFLKNP